MEAAGQEKLKKKKEKDGLLFCSSSLLVLFFSPRIEVGALLLIEVRALAFLKSRKVATSVFERCVSSLETSWRGRENKSNVMNRTRNLIGLP